MIFQSCWAATALSIAALGVSSVAHAAPVSGQGTWQTTLQARTFDGTTIGGYYDTALNITWLADANYAGTTMDWTTANAWAGSLNLNGITNWRLPTTSPVNGTSFNYNCSSPGSLNGSSDCGENISAPGSAYPGSIGSEMAYMFYNTLGNPGQYTPAGALSGCYVSSTNTCLQNTGPFSNLQTLAYWSATEYAPNTAAAWGFYFAYGLQDSYPKFGGLYAWAVHPGDIGAAIVPLPAAVWLFGSGLLGLMGMARREAA